MFDIGFWELGIIGVVALVVIGPERLPAVARTVGRWVGSMQRFVGSVKADIDAEINKQEELKSLIDEQKELKETHEILEQTVSDLKEPTPIPSSPKPAAKSIASEASAKNNPPASGETAADKTSSGQ